MNMDDAEFRQSIRSILADARARTLGDVKLMLELGDEFGDVDLGGWKDLAGILGNPTDVVKTLAGSIANVSNKALTVANIAVKGIPSLIIPFIELNYKNIYAAEERRRREIEKMYPEIFTIARRGFPDDGQLFAFMLNPVAMVAASLGKLGANVALDLVDALAGEAPDVITRTRPLRRRLGAQESLNYNRRLLEMTDNQDDIRSIKKELDGPLGDMLNRSKPVIDLITAAKELKNTSMNDVLDVAENVLAIKSIEDMRSLGLETTTFDSRSDGLTPQDHQAAESVYTNAVKKSVIQALINKESDDMRALDASALMQETGTLDAYRKLISRLETMLRSI